MAVPPSRLKGPTAEHKAVPKTKDLRVDRHGVPVISRDQIELKAEEVIRFFEPSCLADSKPTPLAEICVELKGQYNIDFALNSELGESDSGKKILGRFRLAPRTIYVDSSLEWNSPRWRFTLAHELGHLVLHRHMRAVPRDTDDEIRPDYKAWSPKRWLEWHANKFASAILMPRMPFLIEVVTKMGEMGITKNRGMLYLDEQACNLRTVSVVITHATGVFLVSRIGARIRLQDLGFLVDASTKNFSQLHDFLREE